MAFSVLDKYTVKVPTIVGNKNRNVSVITPNIFSQFSIPKSILKITAPGKYERVSGSSLGGGTYWGLCRLLVQGTSYEDVLDLAETGDSSEVDMLVS